MSLCTPENSARQKLSIVIIYYDHHDHYHGQRHHQLCRFARSLSVKGRRRWLVRHLILWPHTPALSMTSLTQTASTRWQHAGLCFGDFQTPIFQKKKEDLYIYIYFFYFIFLTNRTNNLVKNFRVYICNPLAIDRNRNASSVQSSYPGFPSVFFFLLFLLSFFFLSTITPSCELRDLTGRVQ